MTHPETPPFPRHGGDLDVASVRFGEPVGGWLDLSTGINPNPYPVSAVAAADLARLPGSAALARLGAIARGAYGLAENVSLAATPGSEIAIRLLPHAAPPGSVAIVAPTYGSHGEAWRAAGRQVADVVSIEAVPMDAAIVVLANPNNPDGRIVSPATLAVLARRLADRNGLLVVDEAFADVAPAISLAPQLVDTSALILRSLGKFYGLPGLRLGFAAGPGAVIARLRTLLGDWPVSAPAIALGGEALADNAWRHETRRRLAGSSERLKSYLERYGHGVIGGTDLFTLATARDAAAFHGGLARRGIWTRIFADHPTWIRIGLPADDAGFDHLDRALDAISAERMTTG